MPAAAARPRFEPGMFDTLSAPLRALIADYRARMEAYHRAYPRFYERRWEDCPRIRELATFGRIIETPPPERMHLAVEASAAINCVPKHYHETHVHSARYCLHHVVNEVFAQALSWPLESLLAIAGHFDERPDNFRPERSEKFLEAVERFVAENGRAPELRGPLVGLRRILLGRSSGEDMGLAERLAVLIGPGWPYDFLVETPWTAALAGWLRSLPAKTRNAWIALLRHAGAIGRPKPDEAWLGEAKRLVEKIGSAPFLSHAKRMIEEFHPDPERPEPNTEIVKGLIWCMVAAGLDEATPVLGRFAERSFKKVPGFGPRSMKLGKACLNVLERLPSGVAELAQLRVKVKQPTPLEQIDAALRHAAEAAGLTVDDLEDSVVPRFELDASARSRRSIGDGAAEIEIVTPSRVELSWFDSGGQKRRAPPASVKLEREAFAEAKRCVKDIEATLSAQSRRIEGFALAGRSWPFALWRQRFLEHPLLAVLARRTLWRFGETSALPEMDGFLGADGRNLATPRDDAAVRLWHPIDVGEDEIVAWRELLQRRGVVQPFKQAWREIYVLTDAERRTETYSNRFAGHILRQPQFRALCHHLGWAYRLQGGFDSQNTPERPIPSHGLTAEFWVDGAGEDGEEGAQGYAYLSTDQLRFVRPGRVAVPLAEVPPIVLTEIMREIDLFVGVGSIANDPTWRDRGEMREHFNDYWREHAFGPLRPSGESRKAALASLLPQLAIADRCAIEDRFLAVRGVRGSYRIHLGSANIQMAPDDRYLCIVPDRGAAAADTPALPFERDGMLAIILSKAFMLTEDDRIIDPSILSQLERR